MTTATSFLVKLEQSQLLDDEQLAWVRQQTSQDAIALARALIKREWITRWQGQQLLEAKPRIRVGKYVLLQKLGQGGMGTVYKARQADIGRIVAIKLMSDAVLDRDDAVQRFLRESRAMAAVSHPHIVTAYDVDEHEGGYYLVME